MNGSNPFRGSIMNSPWESAIDVNSIHADVFDVCCNAIDFVRQSHSSAGVLILGSPGSGKTHLLGRLRRHLENRRREIDLDVPRQVFVWIRLSTHPRWLWRHVRKNFVDDLLKRMPDGLTQLEHLLAIRLATQMNEHAGSDLTHWWQYKCEYRSDSLRNELDNVALDCDAPFDLMTVLEHWICRRHRPQCKAWLRGDSLPESALELLGLSVDQGETITDHSAQELAAKEVCLALCRLAGALMPVVLCLDQIEALQVTPDGEEGLGELGNVVRDLHDEARNTVIVSCVQSEYHDRMEARIEGFAKDAMQSFRAQSLGLLGIQNATALIAARLDAAWGREQPGGRTARDLSPFTEQEIKDYLGEAGRSPRELLNYCEARFRALRGDETPKQVDAVESLQSVWDEYWSAATSGNRAADAEHTFADGVPLLVNIGEPEWTVREDPTERDLEFILEGPQQEAKVGVSLCTQQNMNALRYRLQRLRERIARGDLHKLVLLRDARTPISHRAVVTRQRLDELTSDSAHTMVRCDAEPMAALDALRAILSDAQSGDLSAAGQTVHVETLQEWLAAHLASPLRDLCDQLTGFPAILDWDNHEDLFDRVMEVVASRHVVSLAKVATEVDCAVDVLEGLVEQDHRLGFVAGEDAVVFELVTGDCEPSKEGVS